MRKCVQTFDRWCIQSVSMLTNELANLGSFSCLKHQDPNKRGLVRTVEAKTASLLLYMSTESVDQSVLLLTVTVNITSHHT